MTDLRKLERLRELVNASIRDVRVTGYEPLIDGLELPDPGDRHVLAAVIRAGAQVIVTDNRKHFPAAVLARWGVEARTADSFLLDRSGLRRTAAALRFGPGAVSQREDDADV